MRLPRPVAGQTWGEALEASHEYWLMTKAKRRSLRRHAEQHDTASNQPSATPPETKFAVPSGMTAEEATRQKVEADAKEFPIEARANGRPQGQRRSEKLQPTISTTNPRPNQVSNRVFRTIEENLKEWKERGKSQLTGEVPSGADVSRSNRSAVSDVIYTGPRGGRYRINSNGRKSYDVP